MVTTAGDFAEWHPRAPLQKPFEEGDVVEVKQRVLRDQLGMTDEDLEAPGAPAKPERPVRGKSSVTRGKRPPLTKGPMRGKDAFESNDPMARVRPAGKPSGKPTGKSGGKPTGKPTGKPMGKAFGKPMDRKDSKPNVGPRGKPGPRR